MFRDDDRQRRRVGAFGGGQLRAEPDAAGSDAAGDRRLSGVPRGARQVYAADHHAFGQGRGVRQGAGA